MLVLGIETTCDETAAAVVERRSDGTGRILSNIVRSQTEEHARFGGVVPEIAARAHVDVLDRLVDTAMKQAGVGFAQLSAVAAAAGPGLIGGVIVGLTTAKAIAMVHDTPLIAVNHLEAHALTPRLTCALAFPYCLFLASGGHTQIVAVLDSTADRLSVGLRLFHEKFGPPRALVAAGGVAANRAIRGALQDVAAKAQTTLIIPPPALCTDNGAMIAWAGAERMALGMTDTMDAPPRARWLLDANATAPAGYTKTRAGF